ncbi:polysaccharide deacetylase family protein [uncultured Microbulbifer sp.]|uniref:polysaccharide deacetylase family protein n=1 Tax=uncultured Microbulbifer sp. TaxID=348147 RepID=UPI00262193A5|nr:polysaccharide deacetylase family protein [uncultured Microbulbifer sp.]
MAYSRYFCTERLTDNCICKWIGLALKPILAKELVNRGHEIAGHGYRWLDYQNICEAVEREHIRITINSIERLTGKKEISWYTGRTSKNTRSLLDEVPELLYSSTALQLYSSTALQLYSSDAYNGDLSYWCLESRWRLIIPYALVNNDMRYHSPKWLCLC